MALDVQRNWDVAMAENLERLTMKERNEQTNPPPQEEASTSPPPRRGWSRADEDADSSTPREPIHLPDEIVLEIVAYIARSHHATTQPTLAACCLVSRQWYSNAVPLLYSSPRLYGPSFDPFVREICPSKNLSVRDSPLACLVRVLDMSGLVHQATKSTTARLLGRTKGNLEVFIAPQRGFAMNCFPALSKCSNLRTLDLSLVSESPPLPDLFKSVSHLPALHTFRMPRSAGFGVHHKPSAFPWPPNLTHLSLSGGIDAHFLHGVVAFPPTLRSLTIEHCPSAKGYALTHLLRNAVAPLPQLRKLRIAHMPRLSGHALDDILLLLPQLEELSLSVDYITPALFDPARLSHTTRPQPLLALPTSSAAPDPDQPSQPNLLRTLEFTYSGTPADISDKISPLDILVAIDDGVLPRLRQVRVATSLLWAQDEAESLSDVLIEGAKRDWERGEWVFAEMSSTARERCAWWKRAGVWRFEG